MSYPRPIRKPEPPENTPLPVWLEKILAALAALVDLGREWWKRTKRKDKP